jgi:uncharacterized protein with PIN domain
MKFAQFRFYAELNDFLPVERKKKTFSYSFYGTPSVKDTIESIGIPHTEVDLILVNNISVDFTYLLQDGDIISVYPVFESLDITPVIKLRAKPLRKTKFVLDANLGKLARKLRMLGFDTLYQNNYTDEAIIHDSIRDKRIILTRDQGLLKNKNVTHGYWVRSTSPDLQLEEIMKRFDLTSQIKPFRRCMVCNGLITTIDKKEVLHQLPERTKHSFDNFYRCSNCGNIYWRGSHYKKMEKTIAHLKEKTKVP